MSSGNSNIPSVWIEQLKLLEHNAEFYFALPRVLSSSGKAYFAKLGASNEKEQYEGEVESLRAIWEAAPGLAPRVLSSGVGPLDRPFFISDYKDLRRLGNEGAILLAIKLATELHAKPSSNGFGFHVPTYCGLTRLRNGWYESWAMCFDTMIGDLIGQLRDKGCYKELCDLGDQVRQRSSHELYNLDITLGFNLFELGRVIFKLLGPLEIQPVLLHGDLWSGNVGLELTEQSQQPIIFDPASFYGHKEADLAIARIFGGFPPTFYDTYHSLLPKSNPVNEYSHRFDLYELFHYLNHTLIFEGVYERPAKQKMLALLKWADGS